MHEGNFLKERKAVLSDSRKGERTKIYLVAVLLLPEHISRKPDELSMSNNECVFEKHPGLTYRHSFVQLSIFRLIIEPI